MKLLLRCSFSAGLALLCAAALPAVSFAEPPSVTTTYPPKFYETLASAAAKAAAEGTKRVGGKGGAEFFDVLPEGGILVGFDLWFGDYTGHKIIHGIQPIYLTSHGRISGTRRGRQNGSPQRIEAKDGYAVAAIEARGGDRLDSIEVLFWKIHPFDVTLDAEGSYKSEWAGGRGGHKARHPLSSNGSAVIGLTGASGDDVDRLGLVYYDKH